MKINVITLVWTLVGYVVSYTAASAMGLPLSWMFAAMLVGQVFLLYTVYRILTEKYTTRRRFKDWYQDMPKDELDKS